MFGTGELSSLTWDSAAWIYSVIIGVVLARYFMFIANLLQEPKAIKFYYPYLAFILASILNLYMSWYIGKESYTGIEGKKLHFAIRTFMDAIGCIVGLILVPQDKLLEGFFDMKSWFMKIKRAYFFMAVLFYLALGMQFVLGLFYAPEDSILTTEQLIGLSGVAVIVILLHVVSAFSKNDYYLSFHGTFTVVGALLNLSQL